MTVDLKSWYKLRRFFGVQFNGKYHEPVFNYSKSEWIFGFKRYEWIVDPRGKKVGAYLTNNEGNEIELNIPI